jgi:hypothetical protein
VPSPVAKNSFRKLSPTPGLQDHADDLVLGTGKAYSVNAVTRNLMSTTKHIIAAIGTEVVFLSVGFVANSQVLCDGGGPFVSAEENHFDVGVQQRPALQRVALSDSIVAAKWLSCRKKGNHPVRFFFLSFS